MSTDRPSAPSAPTRTPWAPDDAPSPPRPEPPSKVALRQGIVKITLEGIVDVSMRQITHSLGALGVTSSPVYISKWMAELGWGPYTDARGFRRFRRPA